MCGHYSVFSSFYQFFIFAFYLLYFSPMFNFSLLIALVFYFHTWLNFRIESIFCDEVTLVLLFSSLWLETCFICLVVSFPLCRKHDSILVNCIMEFWCLCCFDFYIFCMCIVWIFFSTFLHFLRKLFFELLMFFR